jgi:hypothetical protein
MMTLAWHFTVGWKLRDGTPLEIGRTYEYNGPLKLFDSGLNASVRAIDALKYAHGSVVSLVDCSGDIVRARDRLACTRRRVIWAYDAEYILRLFARECALSVIDNWDAPKVVREYLETGDESIRMAAWEASSVDEWLDARTAARLAARTAARLAARAAARAAAWSDARTAARLAARTAARLAARSDARADAWEASMADHNALLESLLVAGAQDHGFDMPEIG